MPAATQEKTPAPASRRSHTRRKRRLSPTAIENNNRRDRLLQTLYEAQSDLSDLAKSEDMTLAALAAWGNEKLTIDALEGLCRLNDTRAQLLVTRYRTLAAAKLFELAQQDSGGETARKACVDLLKVSLVPVIKAPTATASDNTLNPDDDRDEQALLSESDERAIRQLLAEAGALIAQPQS